MTAFSCAYALLVSEISDAEDEVFRGARGLHNSHQRVYYRALWSHCVACLKHYESFQKCGAFL